MRRNQLAMIVLILTLFSACGKKNRAPRHPSGHIQGAPNYSIQDAASINNYKNRISCSFGQGRRIPDVTFNTTGGAQSASRTTIFGPNFQPGILGGNISKVYVGASTFGDIITVSKVTSGATVVGYNISFSLCNSSPLIMNNRGISNLQTSGIIIDDDADCGVGRVDYAHTRLVADQYSGSYNGQVVNLMAYPFDSVFTKTQCY
ncbi:MAG: hypothetical protein OEY33_08180 [Bdellovibrionales bacterium]|nr:hypothetical protein [Bdellovibrionales bacterium]